MSLWTISNYSLRGKCLEAQGYKCGICGNHINSVQNCTFDHVWPSSRGGFDGLGNVVVAHKSCNFEKKDNIPTGCQIVMLVALCDRMGVKLKLKDKDMDTTDFRNGRLLGRIEASIQMGARDIATTPLPENALAHLKETVEAHGLVMDVDDDGVHIHPREPTKLSVVS